MHKTFKTYILEEQQAATEIKNNKYASPIEKLDCAALAKRNIKYLKAGINPYYDGVKIQGQKPRKQPLCPIHHHYEFYKSGNRYQITSDTLSNAKQKLSKLFARVEDAEVLTIDGAKPEYYKAFYGIDYD